MWRSGTASPVVRVYYLVTNSATFPTTNETGWTQLTSLAFSDATANISTGTTLTTNGVSATISNNVYLYLRWFHPGGSSSDNLGWDSIQFTATAATPTITASGTLAAVNTTYGTASASPTSFTVSGNNLTGNLTVAPPLGFEVSTTIGSGYTTSLTLTASSGSVASTTVYVRLASTATVASSPYSGNITVSGGGATSQTVATASSTVSKKALTITAANQTVSYGTAVATVTGAGSYTPTGFVNGDTSAVIGGSATYTTTYTTTTAAGSNVATITPVTTGLTAANYSFTPANGNISVTAVAPSAPTITAITAAGSGELSVAFTAPSSNGGVNVTDYKVSVAGVPYVSVGSTSSPLLITGLTNGTQVSIKIRAVNSAGDGAESNSVNGTPVAPAVATISVSPATFASALTTTYGTASSTANFTVAGSTLSGNLTVTAPTGLQVSLTVGGSYTDSLELTAISGTVTATTVYARLKANAAAGTYNSQNIAVSGGSATTQNVATSSSGNTVSQAALTITGISITSKTYDGSTSATISGTAAYGGLQNGETFSVTGTPTATFGDKNVGAGKSVTVSGFTAPSANYTVTQPAPTGAITAKALSITASTIASKTYDGTTTAGAVTVGTLSGFVGSETVTATGAAAAYSSANVGTYNNVAITYTLANGINGGLATNYSLAAGSATGTINKANQTITFTNVLTGLLSGSTNALSATANSQLPVSYAVGDTNVATLSGTNLIAGAQGTSTVVASQSGNDNYNAATPVTNNVSVVRSLQAGDIAVITFQTDDSDQFSFVALETISAGTQISFTDNAWSGTALATNENTIVWTAPAGGVTAGTIVTFTDGSGFSTGTFTGSFNGAAVAGDQVLAYIGSSASPTFIYGLSTTAWITTGSPSNNTSYLPTGLTNGTTARDFSTEVDNQYYNVTSFSGTKAEILASIGTVGNWARDNTRYSSIPARTITVLQPQTITFSGIGAKTYGDSSFALSATANSTLAVTFTSSDPTVASVDGNTVTILKAGSANIVASQAGGTTNSITYAAATPVTNSLTVSPKALTVTAEAKSKVFGAGDPALTYTSSGLVGDDSLSGSLGRAAGENVGTYAINQGTLANANYNISFTGANLTITAAALPAITWGTSTISSSGGVSGFSYLYTGRSSNGISTVYSNSVVPPGAGYYTAVATSTDGNYSGSSTNQFHVAGPVPVSDAVSRPTTTMNIPLATLLQNDKRIDSSGNVQTNNLSITAVAQGTGSPTVTLTNPFVYFVPGGGGPNSQTFTYILNDSVANKTATGTVTVTAMIWDNAFAVTGTQGTAVYANGITEVTLTFNGTPHVTYWIQYTGTLGDAQNPTVWKDARGWYSENGTFEVYIQEEGNHAADWNGSMFFQGKR